MTQKEVSEITDLKVLLGHETYYQEASIIIETNLQFPGLPGEVDADWYRRARAALSAYRLCIYRLERQIKWARRTILEEKRMMVEQGHRKAEREARGEA